MIYVFTSGSYAVSTVVPVGSVASSISTETTSLVITKGNSSINNKVGIVTNSIPPTAATGTTAYVPGIPGVIVVAGITFPETGIYTMQFVTETASDLNTDGVVRTAFGNAVAVNCVESSTQISI